MDALRNVVVSGIRATGKMHLGNYLGALRYFVELASDPANLCYFFIANLHTLTTRMDAEALKRDLKGIVLDFLAVGLNPERAVIYAQSSVPETTELAWILSCMTSVSRLMGMPHFKDKKAELEAGGQLLANAGLLTYPVLMSADILGPRANLVPVGEDQHTHVELTREQARSFNRFFGETFPIPELLTGSGIRVPSLDASGKMGKSNPDGVIFLDDPPEAVKRKLMRAVTDPQRRKLSDPGDPDVCNIFSLHHLLSTPDEIKEASESCRKATRGCKDCKLVVSHHINDLLAPILERRAGLLAKDLGLIEEILHEGGEKARVVIAETVKLAKDRVGIPAY